MLLLCVLMGLACERPDESRAPRTEQRDSAGIMVYESVVPHWQDDSRRWSVGASPALRLTGAPAAHYRVSDATELPGGGFVVAQPYELQLYSSSGRFIRSIGREGPGPGEFGSGPTLAVLDSTLVAFDPRWGRMTLLDFELGFLADVRLDGGRYTTDFGALSSGFVLLKAQEAFGPDDVGIVRQRLPILFLSRSGEVVDTLAIVEGPELLRLPRGERGFLLEAPIFARRPSFALGNRGLVLGDADALEFRTFELDGGRERLVRGLEDLRVEPAVIDSERVAVLGDSPSPAMRELWADMLAAMPDPVKRPAFRSLEIDPTGAVWLETFLGESEIDQARVWEVFSVDGQWLGEVDMPRGFQAYEIGADHVLGVQFGEQGTEEVVVLPLTR